MLRDASEWSAALDLLRADGVECTNDVQERLDYHLNWVRQWNRLGGFVSIGDESYLARHTVDSASLLIHARPASALLDIGSGGGFPAIPLAILAPATQFVLMERSAKKAGLMIGLISELGLRNVSIVVGAFPQAECPVRPDVVTARAVERPERVHRAIGKLVEAGAVFLCQSDPAWWQKPMFHVEQINDRWTEAQLRRSILYKITRT